MSRTKIPPLELLKANHLFPGPYTFKAIGRNEALFVARTVAALRDALGYAEDPPYSTREAQGGRHVAVTLEVFIEKAEQVLDAYQKLSAVKGLVLLL